MKKNDIKFDFDDILIEPNKKTNINSRSLIDNGHYINNIWHYPMFTAPMDSVVDLNNMKEYLRCNIPVVLPRTVTFDDYKNYIIEDQKYNKNLFPDFTFMSFSLKDFKNITTIPENESHVIPKFILIDTANGHLEEIMEAIKVAKKKNKNLVIMVGNIANPKTYEWYAKSNLVDYIRIGIGNGGGCFINGTLVKTNNGHKNIENIENGDLVLTHNGNYKEVINTINYVCEDDNLIKINDIISTKDHDFFVINIEDEDKININNYMDFAFWLSAEKIDPNQHRILELDVDD